jgi:hypothetical protein
MEHAEAHERLADLSLEPGHLARLDDDPSATAAELRAHLATCERCAADLAGWRRTWAEVSLVWRAGDESGPGHPPAIGLGAGDELVQPPAELRQQIMEAIRADPRRPGRVAAAIRPGAAPGVALDAAAGRDATAARGATADAPAAWHRAVLAWRAGIAGGAGRPSWVAVAALVVALLAVTAGWLRTVEVGQLRHEQTELAAAVATLDRVLAAEPYWTVTLRAADGKPGGTLAWSQQEVVVITSGLPAPGPGQAYRCWLEVDGTRSPMGEMAFSRSTGYWAGARSEYGPALVPGGSFGVSLVETGGAGTPVLVGQL